MARDNNPLRWETAARTVLVAMVAIPLLYSGYVHAIQPFYFARHISDYELLPSGAVAVVVFFAPYFFLVVGTCLVFRGTREFAFIAATLLFGTFALFQAFTLVSKKEIACGCFGFESEKVSYGTILIPITCLLTSIGLAWWPERDGAAKPQA